MSLFSLSVKTIFSSKIQVQKLKEEKKNPLSTFFFIIKNEAIEKPQTQNVREFEKLTIYLMI
jgi:hypothetical protein